MHRHCVVTPRIPGVTLPCGIASLKHKAGLCRQAVVLIQTETACAELESCHEMAARA